MASLSDVRTAVGAMLASVMAGRTLVYGRIGDAPAPSGPYVMYRIDTVEHPAYPVQRLTAGVTPAPNNQTIISDARIGFVISVVGGEAMQDAETLQLVTRMTQRWGDIYKLIGHGGFSSVRDLSAVEVGTWRARAEFTWTVTASITVGAVPDVIDQQAMTLDESSDGATKTEEITVTKGVKPYGC